MDPDKRTKGGRKYDLKCDSQDPSTSSTWSSSNVWLIGFPQDKLFSNGNDNEREITEKKFRSKNDP